MAEPTLYEQPEDVISIGSVNKSPVVQEPVKNKEGAFLANYLKENPDQAKEINAPLTGKDIQDLMNRHGGNFTPTQEQFKLWKKEVFPEIEQNWGTVIKDSFIHLFKVAIDTPVGLGEVATKEKYKDDRFSTISRSSLEGVAKSGFAMYNMLAVEPNPDKGIVNSAFRFSRWARKEVGELTQAEDEKEQYNQFLDDYRMMNWYKNVSEGKEGVIFGADQTNAKVVEGAVLAMDVLSFEAGLGLGGLAARRAGSALLATEAGQFAKMSRIGQALGKIPEFTAAVKTGVVGGTIKYTGKALEFVGGTVKNTIKWGVDTGSEILEAATGFDAKSWKSGIKFTGLGGSAFDIFSHGISGVGAKVGATLAVAGGARVMGEGLSALGETILKNSGKRGFLTFAEMALEETPNLSRGAKGVLKAISFADPMFSYAATATEGLIVGGGVGAGFGYVTAGVEGIPSGIGAGAAFGLMGGLLGRSISDVAGYTRHQYGAVQAKFVLENWKQTKPDMHKYWEDALKGARNNAERASIIQQITGMDLVAPNVNWYSYKPEQIETFLRKRGLDMEGYKIDKETGVRIKDSNGNEVKAFGGTGIQIANSQGFTYVVERGTDGTVRSQSVFLREGDHGIAGRHELAHTIFKGTKMYDDFMKKMHSVLLGKYNEKGEKLSNANIDPDSFREFYRLYLKDLHTQRDVTGKKIIVDGETTDIYKAQLESVDKAIERYKSDNQTLTTDQQKQNLAYFVEEFGAYYFDNFLKGKSIDWLFRGGKLKGLRGVFENIHDSYLERLSNDVSRYAPKEMEFGVPQEDGFSTKNGSRIVIPQLDLMMRDLVRASAGNKRSKSFSLKDMTPEQRTTFIAGSGLDGLNFTHDKDGNRLPSARTKQLRNEWGKKILESLKKLDPTIKDSFSFTHETSGFTDVQLAHLVNDGVFSKELANRIKLLQEAVNPNSGLSNVFETIYQGASEEQIGMAQRKYGNNVDAKHRLVVVHGFDFSLDAKGNLKFNVKTIDKQLMDSYGSEQWVNPEVRALWGDNRNAFDKSVMDYIENASKDSSVRKESALLLDNGDGLGGERRNVMHQIVAFAKKKSAEYANKPTADIERIALSTRMDMSPDLMSHTESTPNARYVYNDKNAFSFISENFKPSNMESEKTPQGKILKNEQGYSIITGVNNQSKAYDAKGNLVGVFLDAESAGKALLSAYENNAKVKERIIKNIPKSNEVQQGSFMVLSTEQRLEAIKRGNVWDVLKDWVGSGKVIPQTREEFYLQKMVELRQQDPKTVYDAVLSIYQQKFEPVEKAHAEAVTKLNEHNKKEFNSNLTPEIINSNNPNVQVQIEVMNNLRREVRRLELMLEYGEPLKKLLESTQGGKKPENVLTKINLLRQNSIAYDYVAKNIFGDAYDSQFETGKPFATRATHGTTSEKMLGLQAELSKEGLNNNSRFQNPEDLIGGFLSGETKTSYNYSYGDDPKLGAVTRQIRSAIKMENPFVIDLKNVRYASELYSKIYAKAKAGGHDGIVIKNVRDAGQTDTVFVVMGDKLKSNVVKLDSHKTSLAENRKNPLANGTDYTDANASAFLEPRQEGLPIGDRLMTYSDLGGNFMPSKDYSTERAYNARVSQPMKLWKYPSTTNFKMWAGNLPLIKDVLSQSKPASIENGFVTTVYKGVNSRNFDTFENRSKTFKGEPKDKYGRIIKEGDKDPNYFISEYEPASTYARDTIGYEKQYPKMFKNLTEKDGLSNGKADMYYVKSENPAVFTNVTKQSKVYSELHNWWKDNVEAPYAKDSLKDNPKRYSKLAEYNFDAFVDMINKGEFRENIHWEQADAGVSYWQDFSKDFLNKGYDSVVIKDITTHKSTPTIIIDQASSNVKASSNYGDFSITDNRYNFKPSSESSSLNQKPINKPSNTLTGSFMVRDAKKVLTESEQSKLKIVREILPAEYWENLKATGRVVKNFDFRKISKNANGSRVFIINPDSMIAGNVKIDGKYIVKDALGGSNFGATKKASESGEMWANAQAVSKVYENKLNLAYEQNLKDLIATAKKENWSLEKLKLETDNLETHMIITKGSDTKVLSNPTAFNGTLEIIKKFHKEGMVDEAGIKKSFQQAAEKMTGGEDAQGNPKPLERVQPDWVDFTDIKDLPLNDFLKEVSLRMERTFQTRGNLNRDMLMYLKSEPEMITPKSVAKLKAMFDNPKYLRVSLAKEVSKILSEPYLDNVAPSEAFASMGIKGKVKISKSSHPDYPYSIVSEGIQKPTLYLFSDTIHITDMVYTPAGKVGKPYDFGSGSVGWGEAKMKPIEKLPKSSYAEGTGRMDETFKGGSNYSVSPRVKKVVSDVENSLFDINKRSVISAGIQNAFDKFKEALRKQDATNEIVVKEVEQTHTELLNAIKNEMKNSSEATLPDLRTIKKKVEAIDRGLKQNQTRIGDNVKKNYQSEMNEGANIESQQAIRRKNEVEQDMQTGADLESEQSIRAGNEVKSDMETGAIIEGEQAFDKTQKRVAEQEANMAEGARIESEQAFDAKEQAQAEVERQSDAQAQPQPSAEQTPQPEPAQPIPEPAQPTPAPQIEQPQMVNPWRYWGSENISKDSGVWKNAVNYTIVLLNTKKYKVYNSSGKNIGIYDDLNQAKLRVQREEPKKR